MAISFDRARKILKAKYYKELCKFMEGQTVDEYGIYDDDFLRFIKQMGVID